MAGDASYNSVALLLHGEGFHGATTILDSGPGAKAMTANGNAAVSTAQSKFSTSSLAFDGTGDYFSTPDHNDFDFGTGDFTIEGWVRFASVAGTQAIVSNYQGASNGWSVQLDGAVLKVNLTGDGVDMTGATTIVVNTWYHFAVSRSGTAAKLYLDGVQDASATDSSNITSTAIVAVGRLGSYAGSYLNGFVNDLRITKGVARYTAGFTPTAVTLPDGLGQVSGQVADESAAAAARVVRAYRRDGGNLVAERYSGPGDPYFPSVVSLVKAASRDGVAAVTDLAQIPRTWTANGNAAQSDTQTKYGLTSLAFDGTGDYFSSTNSADFNFGTEDFTIECWVRFNAVSGSPVILGNYQGVSNGMTLGLDSSSRVVFSITGDGIDSQGTTALSVDTWYHIEASRSGSTLKLFLDGVQEDSDTNSSSITSTAGMMLGRTGVTASNYLNGYLDDVRITRGVARHTAGFTPPTDRYPAKTVGSLGDYSFYTTTLDELMVLALDDATTGTIYNDQVIRVIPA